MDILFRIIDANCRASRVHPMLNNVTLSLFINYILFSHQVRHLEVRRNAFAGISVDGTFQMMEVTMEKIPSLAFDFDYVKDFIIDRSRIDRVAMWGIKPQKCDSFSILGGSRLYSLGTNALELRCNKFMLGYNTFDR